MTNEVLPQLSKTDKLDFSKTIILTHEKYTPGKRLLITANDPGGYNVAEPIIKAALLNSNYTSVTVMVSGFAANSFYEKYQTQFDIVEPSDSLILPKLLEISDSKPFDIAIATVSETNGPEPTVLYNAKSVFGAKKLYFVVDGWTGIGKHFQFRDSSGRLNRTQMNTIDAIICNDNLAKNIIQATLPEFPEDKILPIGTPVLDSLKLDEGESLRKEGRKKLELSDDTWSFLYLGAVDADFVGYNPAVNTETLSKTLEAFRSFAAQNPNKKLAFLLRTHPRDPKKEILFSMFDGFDLPANVVKIRAMGPLVSMPEAAWSCDAVASISSTENFLAPLRGKPAIFLGFEGDGLGQQIIKDSFSEGVIKTILESEITRIINGTDQMAKTLSDLANIPQNVKTISSEQKDYGSIVTNILSNL